MNLETDTLYFRHDHPLGFMFSAGNPEPDPADGWTLDQDNIPPGPEHVYECSTPAAWEALVNSERSANRATAAKLLATTMQAQAIAAHHASALAEIERLNGLLASNLNPEG